MAKTIFISNRLPVSIGIPEAGDSFSITASIGGLATGLKTVHESGKSLWIGWNGIASESIPDSLRIEQEKELLSDFGCIPVYFNASTVETFYEGYCNKTIWPLFHYFTEKTQWSDNLWEDYVTGQKQFLDVLRTVIGPNDTVWIHDYQLMLLPNMIRQEFPEVTIGFFLHIPFPSSEIFRLIPQRKQLLEGLLGANLIGFHTYDYARHFISCTRRILGIESNFGRIAMPSHVAVVDTFPMGIDYERYSDASKEMIANPDMNVLIEKVAGRKIILSVDRLDYTKGIPERIGAFKAFLETNGEYCGKVHLVLIAAPSRSGVEAYQNLQKEVEELVGHVNGKHAHMGWIPIWFFCRPFSFDELVSLYRVSDVLLCTPLRDGMNLVVKEYIAARTDRRGAIVLSETAGAASELGEAFLVNPNDNAAIAHAILQALEMPEAIQADKMSAMQKRIMRYSVQKWSHDFLDRLKNLCEQTERFKQRFMKVSDMDKLVAAYRSAGKRLLVLDYDGTLVPLASLPSQAIPDLQLYSLIEKLSADPKNSVMIISGRKKQELDEWFGMMNITLSAEHGLWLRERGSDWVTSLSIDDSWKKDLLPVLEAYVDRTPGSFIEEKTVGFAWHYRNSEPELAEVRLNELRETLMGYIQNHPMSILSGSKVLELRDANASKGTVLKKLIERHESDFILCAGDDTTDEDMFMVLPDLSWSIRIGETNTKAAYNMASYRDIRVLFERITATE